MNSFGCKRGIWPSSYLGRPLGGNSNSIHFWQLLVEKIQHKLHNWKYAYISKGGRHTLIQVTLSNLPTYYLSLFKAPSSIINCLERLVRDVLWEGARGDGGVHNVNWGFTQRPQALGGPWYWQLDS